MNRHRQRRIVTLLTLLAIGLVMANSVIYPARIDLTERRLHTISPVTRELLSGLEHEATIVYYRSSRLVDRFPEPREIADLLDEYEAASRGSVAVRVVDPARLGRPEDVEALGIVPQQLDVTEDGERRTATVYSGIVVEYLDRRASIPFVFETATLEYELTTAIDRLVRDAPRYLAFVLGDRSRSIETTYRFVASELARSYEVRVVRPGETIPDDVDAVVVTDAQRLLPEEVEALGEYVDRGGSLLVTLNAVEVDVMNDLRARAVGDAPVRGLLARFGVVAGDTLLLDESHNQIRVEEVAADMRVVRAYPYPHWPVTLAQYTSGEHPVTARHPGLDLYWPTWLALSADDRAEIIVASTPVAWLMDEPFELDPQRAGELRRDADRTTAQYGLVAVSRPDRGGGRIAVVSDADFLRDEFLQATGSGHNLEFVQNLAQWLTNDEALLSIRTRATRTLTLSAVTDPVAEGAIQFTALAVNVILVPGVVAVWGFLRLRRRRRAHGASLR